MDYQSRVLEWGSNYTIKADIADFYGSVDHAILGPVTSTHLPNAASPPLERVEDWIAASLVFGATRETVAPRRISA